jgi:hypothetical protein
MPVSEKKARLGQIFSAKSRNLLPANAVVLPPQAGSTTASHQPCLTSAAVCARYSIPWPKSFTTLFNFSALANLQIFTFPGLACVYMGTPIRLTGRASLKVSAKKSSSKIRSFLTGA